MKGRWSTFLGDPKLWRGPLLSFLVLTGIVNVLAWRSSVGLHAARLDTLMSGQGSGPVHTWSSPTPGPPRYDFSVGEEPGTLLATIPDATARRLIVFSSMSQAYVVNDRKPGDRVFVEIVDDAIEPDGAGAWGFFAPNLTNEELVLQVLALTRTPKTTPAVLVLGLCFDKYRNIDLRPGYRALLAADPELRKSWAEVASRYETSRAQAAAKMRSTLEALAVNSATGEESLSTRWDRRFRTAAGTVFPLVANRTELNGYAQQTLFEVRNAVLRIDPTTKRPILRARYEMNLEFLDIAIELAEERGIEPLLYIVPLNPQASSPYVPAEYDEFKVRMRAEAERYGVRLANFEDVVPATDWGEFMGGADFKHFRGAGHEATARALLAEFGDRFRGGAPVGGAR